MNIWKVTGQVIRPQLIKGTQTNVFHQPATQRRGAAARASIIKGVIPGSLKGRDVQVHYSGKPKSVCPPSAQETKHESTTGGGPAFVISADLKGYSEREGAWARTLPGRSTAGVRALRNWLNQAIRESCRKAQHELVWFQEQGGTWFFPVPKASAAHRIAEALDDAAATESAASEMQTPLQFRISIALSTVSDNRPPPSRFHATTGSTASRLRDISEPRGTIICRPTWRARPPNAQMRYVNAQSANSDKHGQAFAMHRCLKGPAPTAPFSTTKRSKCCGR